MHTQSQEHYQPDNFDRAMRQQEKNIAVTGRIRKETDQLLWKLSQSGEIDDYLFRYVNAIKCSLNPLGVCHKSQAQLAKKGRMSVRKAQYCRREAEEKLGLRVEYTRKEKGRRQGKNKYYLPAYLKMKSQEQARGKKCTEEDFQGAQVHPENGHVRVHRAPLLESLESWDGLCCGDDQFGVTHSVGDEYQPMAGWEILDNELKQEEWSIARYGKVDEDNTYHEPITEIPASRKEDPNQKKESSQEQANRPRAISKSPARPQESDFQYLVRSDYEKNRDVKPRHQNAESAPNQIHCPQQRDTSQAEDWENGDRLLADDREMDEAEQSLPGDAGGIDGVAREPVTKKTNPIFWQGNPQPSTKNHWSLYAVLQRQSTAMGCNAWGIPMPQLSGYHSIGSVFRARVDGGISG